MKSAYQSSAFAALVLGAALLGIQAAGAATTFNLLNPTTPAGGPFINQSFGQIGAVYGPSVGGVPTGDGLAVTSGFISRGTGAFTTLGAPNLFGKSVGGDQVGLGLVGTTDNEITGDNAIRVQPYLGGQNFPGIVIDFSFASVQSPDAWSVYGSLAPNFAGPFTLIESGTDEATHALSGFNFYLFATDATVPGSTVLLGNTFTVSPLPGALPLFASGLLGGFWAWRRKRKGQVGGARFRRRSRSANRP